MTLDQLYRHLDDTQEVNIQVLREVVGIESKNWNTKMATMAVKWAEKRLRMLGAEVEEVTLKGSGACCGQPAPLLLATLGVAPDKKCLLVYGNVTVSERCSNFKLKKEDGVLCGSGVTYGKGPLAVWFRTLEAFQQLKMDIPVNLRFAISGCDVDNVDDVEDALFSRRQTFLKNVDLVCLPAGNWLTDKRPCLVYGMRGVCHLWVEVKGANYDLQGGFFGGLVREPLDDLRFLLCSMMDARGKIVVPCVMEDVAPITLEEEDNYKKVHFEPEKLRQHIGASQLAHKEDKVRLMMHNWSLPSLSIHGISGTCFGDGVNPMIPSCVVGKFSITLVQNQTPTRVAKAVTRYLEEVHASRQSSNTLSVRMVDGALPWANNPTSPHYMAAQRAASEVYHKPVDMIRVGTSISMVSVLARMLSCSVLVLPIAPYFTSDRIKLELYLSAHKMVAAYLVQVAALSEL